MIDNLRASPELARQEAGDRPATVLADLAGGSHAHRNQVEAADARKRQALAQYQKTVLGALQDVADALVAYQKYGDVERQLEEEVRALRRAREIADARYRIGYASYFDVINADRDLFVAELALAQTYTNSWDSLVRLYASLGGGWQEADTGQGQTQEN